MIITPYSIFTDFSVLAKAHQLARKAGRDKNSIVKFEWDLLGQLAKLKEELIGKSYRLAPYFCFKVFEPKPRVIYALEYRDRIVQHVMCDNILEPYFSKRIIYDNAGCVKQKGQHFAIKRLKGFLIRHYRRFKTNGYYLKCDIKKFYPSLSHEVIKKTMSSRMLDIDVKNLFNAMIDSFETPREFLVEHGIPLLQEDKLTPIKRGVPIGNQTSQIIGMYYLNPIDRLIKQTLGVKNYIRYMDDFIIVHQSKEFLQNALELIKQRLFSDLKLLLNKKTQIVPIKNGITFLGNRVVLTDNGRVYNRIVPRTIKRFKTAVKAFNANAGDIPADKILSTIASYKGHCKHSKSRGKAVKIAQRLNIAVKKPAYADIMAEIASDEMF